MPRKSRQTLLVPQLFAVKKQKILAELSVPTSEYADKSPKGSVDTQILDLINLINSHEGWVTTSSCSGRVTVFVEGPTADDTERNQSDSNDAAARIDAVTQDTSNQIIRPQTIKTTPGGKGGGHWLFVSHDPTSLEAISDIQSHDRFLRQFGLDNNNDTTPLSSEGKYDHPNLIHLQFSPLILHVLCASLQHAKPLLAAAINAGFRESGVQSLKALDEPEKGVMVGIRTNGLGFETVVGMKMGDEGSGEERMQALVTEEYLRVCVKVIEERFRWNEMRKRRLMEEIRVATKVGRQNEEWEDKDARARRKREEGLKRRAEIAQNGNSEEVE